MLQSDNQQFKKMPLQAALELASYHIPVIPLCPHDHSGMSEDHSRQCKNRGKAPIISNWGNNASTDTSQIRQWYRKKPHANVGAVLGKRLGLIAIDVDGEFGLQKLKEFAQGDLPPTWEYTTPGSDVGYRYLYRSPQNYEFHKKTFSDPEHDHSELALLGDGQCTVMPGSIHANGKRYEWVSGRSPADIEIADAPEWMLKLMSLSYSASVLFGEEESGHRNETVKDEQTTTHPSTSTHKLTSTTKSAFSPSDLKLSILLDKCPHLKEKFECQASSRCSEEDWFQIVSFLTGLGIQDARAFSQMSNKHNEESERRVAQLSAEMDKRAPGHTRCTTFGCNLDQIRICFGDIRKNEIGEITNSPVGHLKGIDTDPSAYETLREVMAMLEPTRYTIQKNKLGQMITKKEESVFSAISNCVIVPKRDIFLDDGSEQSHWFEMDCFMIGQKRFIGVIRVKDSEFSDLKWITKWGLSPNLEPGSGIKDRMRHSIQVLARHSVRETVYSHLGFRKISDKWRYLHAGGCLGENRVQVDVDQRLSKYVLPKEIPNVKTAVKASLSLLDIASKRVTVPLLATVFLAPLCEILRQQRIEPAFLLWLHGQTGAHKSTLAALFMCHFGRFDSRGAPASFKDTSNSLEKRAFDTKDSVLWMDDFHPTSNLTEAKRMEQTAQSLLRAYGDRVGRGRMKQDASLRIDYPPRGLSIVTGEQLPRGHSSNARLFGIELTKQDLDMKLLTHAQAKSDLLAQAMSAYISWVSKRMCDPNFGKQLSDDFSKHRESILNSSSHGRIAESAAGLLLAIECLLDFALETGVLTVTERERVRKDSLETLLLQTDVQSEGILEVSPARQFLSIVSALIQNGTFHVTPVKGSATESEGMTNHKHVGMKDNKYFYLMPDIIFNEVSDFLGKENQQLPLDKSALWKALETEGALVSESNGKGRVKRCRRKSIDGVMCTTIWIKREWLEELDEPTAQRNETRAKAIANSAVALGSTNNPFDES